MALRDRKSKNKSTLKRVAIGGAIAASAGYVAGLLTAPKSGKQTRQDLKDRAERSRADAEKELKKLHTDLDKTIKQAKSSTDKAGKDLVTKAKDTKEKAREVLSAIHEGDAEDKDLRKAIKDANAALGHLKDYLKK